MPETQSVMAPNAFIGSATRPADEDLSRVLRSAKPVWDELIASLAADCGVNAQEWKCYSSKSGWSLRLLRGKRTVVWLAPCEGRFQAAYIFGAKAMAAARATRFPKRIVRALDEAVQYPEGAGVRLMVDAAGDLPHLKKLAAIKIQN